MPRKKRGSSKRGSKRGSRRRSRGRGRGASARPPQPPSSSSGASDEVPSGGLVGQMPMGALAMPPGQDRRSPRRSRTPSPAGAVGGIPPGVPVDESSYVGQYSPNFSPRAQDTPPGGFSPLRMDMSNPQSPISQPSTPGSLGGPGFQPILSPTPPTPGLRPPPVPGNTPVSSEGTSGFQSGYPGMSKQSMESGSPSRSRASRRARSAGSSPASRSSGRRTRSASPRGPAPAEMSPLHNRTPRGRSRRGRGGPRKLDFDASQGE